MKKLDLVINTISDNIDLIVDDILNTVVKYSFSKYLPQDKKLIKNVLLKINPFIFEITEKLGSGIDINDFDNKEVLDFIKKEVLKHYKIGIGLSNFLHFIFIIFESYKKLICRKFEKECSDLSERFTKSFMFFAKEIMEYWESIKYDEVKPLLAVENLKLVEIKNDLEKNVIIFRSFLHFIGGLIIVLDKDLNIIYISDEFQHKYGVDLKDIKNFYQFHSKFHTDSPADCNVIKAIHQNNKTDFVEKLHFVGKKEALFRIVISEDYQIDNHILKIIFFQDLFENLESILFREISNAAEFTILLTDTSGNIEYVNKFFEKITGYSANEVIGQNPRILKSGAHDEKFYKNLWETILSGNVWKGRFKNKKKDGSFYYEKAIIIPIKDLSGNIIKFAALKEDITIQVELENQLYLAQRFDYLNRLVSRFAHDFNNILTYLYAINDDIERYAKSDKLKDLVSGSKNALVKVADMIKGLMAFGRKHHLELEKVTVKDIYDDFISMNKKFFPSNIVLISDFKDLTYINADKMLMSQVLYNIFTNSKEAILKKFGSAEGGKISIITEKNVFDSPLLVKVGEFDAITVKPNSYVIIKISDNGIGIAKKDMEHIFEPFFTTKSEGEGVGIGLAASYGIIKQHNGYIFISSTEGIGTEVKIMLPEYSEIKKDEKVEFKDENTKIYKLPNLSVMVVDDDFEILTFIEKVLTTAGVNPVKFDNYNDAISYITKSNDLDFIVVDYLLPDGSGLELYQKAVEKFLKLRAIIISGMADDNLRNHPDFNRRFIFLKKPFKGSSLINLMKFLLEAVKI